MYAHISINTDPFLSGIFSHQKPVIKKINLFVGKV